MVVVVLGVGINIKHKTYTLLYLCYITVTETCNFKDEIDFEQQCFCLSEIMLIYTHVNIYI